MISLPILRPSRVCHTCIRTLTTTTPLSITARPTPETCTPLPPEIPPYPYPAAQWYKQSDRGLYGNQRIQFGNNVGPRSKVKTRRTWAVNVLRKRLWSNSLNTWVQLKVSKRVLRTIDKVGGLDQYLLGEKEGRLKGLGLRGWELRCAVMMSARMRKRFGLERGVLRVEALRGEVEALEGKEVESSVEEGLDAGEELKGEVDASRRQRRMARARRRARRVVVRSAYPSVRIAPRRRLFLTQDGFRARPPVPKPDPTALIKRQVLREAVRPKQQTVSEALNAQLEQLTLETKQSPQLSAKQKRQIIQQVKKQIEAEWEGSTQFEERVEQRTRIEQRKAAKREQAKRNRRLQRRQGRAARMAKRERMLTSS